MKYINDFCRTSDYKDVSFVVVDNTPNEENGNVISENLLESGFARSENYNLNDMKFKHIRTFNRNGITLYMYRIKKIVDLHLQTIWARK